MTPPWLPSVLFLPPAAAVADDADARAVLAVLRDLVEHPAWCESDWAALKQAIAAWPSPHLRKLGQELVKRCLIRTGAPPSANASWSGCGARWPADARRWDAVVGPARCACHAACEYPELVRVEAWADAAIRETVRRAGYLLEARDRMTPAAFAEQIAARLFRGVQELWVVDWQCGRHWFDNPDYAATVRWLSGLLAEFGEQGPDPPEFWILTGAPGAETVGGRRWPKPLEEAIAAGGCRPRARVVSRYRDTPFPHDRLLRVWPGGWWWSIGRGLDWLPAAPAEAPLRLKELVWQPHPPHGAAVLDEFWHKLCNQARSERGGPGPQRATGA